MQKHTNLQETFHSSFMEASMSSLQGTKQAPGFSTVCERVCVWDGKKSCMLQRDASVFTQGFEEMCVCVCLRVKGGLRRLIRHKKTEIAFTFLMFPLKSSMLPPPLSNNKPSLLLLFPFMKADTSRPGDTKPVWGLWGLQSVKGLFSQTSDRQTDAGSVSCAENQTFTC